MSKNYLDNPDCDDIDNKSIRVGPTEHEPKYRMTVKSDEFWGDNPTFDFTDIRFMMHEGALSPGTTFTNIETGEVIEIQKAKNVEGRNTKLKLWKAIRR